jgi:predicted Fe-Mo cluster-binding NifX family protein
MMWIAATTREDEISGHFAEDTFFTVFQVEGREILKQNEVFLADSRPEFVVGFLRQIRVEKLLCGEIDAASKAMLEAAGIETTAGVYGAIGDIMPRFLAGEQIADPLHPFVELPEEDDCSCGCGEHHHEAGECGCGGDDGCGCGHTHGHGQECGCGCGEKQG